MVMPSCVSRFASAVASTASPCLIRCEGQIRNAPLFAQAHRRPRLLPRLSCGLAFSARFRQLRAGERGIGEALADDALEREYETHSVGFLSVVETKSLFV